MMVGIDVTHPGPGSREGTPSIAAVVASVDDSFVQFPASLRIQESKKEASLFYIYVNKEQRKTLASDVGRIDGYAGGTITGI